MSTSIFTMIDPEERERIGKEISKAGYEYEQDGPTFQVIIDTPFNFEIYSRAGERRDNVDEMLNRVTSAIARLRGITNTNWYIGSSHPDLIKRYDLTKPTKKEADMFKFTEWCEDNFFRHNGSWISSDLSDERGYTTEELLTKYKSEQ